MVKCSFLLLLLLPLRSLFDRVQELEIFTNAEFRLFFFLFLIFFFWPINHLLCLWMSVSHPNSPPGWCNETKGVQRCHAVDGIKDPLYHDGQNNKSKTTVLFCFFKRSERSQGKAFVRIRSPHQNTSILVPSRSEKCLTLSAFILNTKIEYVLHFIFLSHRLESKRTDRFLTLVWWCLLWRAFHDVEKNNSFDKFCGKQCFEKILFAKSNLTMQSAIAQFLLSYENWCDSLLTEYKRLRWKKIQLKKRWQSAKGNFAFLVLSHLIIVFMFNGFNSQSQ